MRRLLELYVWRVSDFLIPQKREHQNLNSNAYCVCVCANLRAINRGSRSFPTSLLPQSALYMPLLPDPQMIWTPVPSPWGLYGDPKWNSLTDVKSSVFQGLLLFGAGLHYLCRHGDHHHCSSSTLWVLLHPFLHIKGVSVLDPQRFWPWP